MRYARSVFLSLCLCAATVAGMRFLAPAPAADHNDPNAVNSIFSNVDVSAADLYDLFGFPSDDATGGEKVVIALTFASAPSAGVFDTDLLYRILIAPGLRVAPQIKDDTGLEILLKYTSAITKSYLSLKPSEVRVRVDKAGRANVDFMNFPSGPFTKVIDTNKVTAIDAPGGVSIKAFIGGRDDAFFNDLPGFFRSINYAPQFYRVPLAMTETRELPIPKTLLELEGNKLFNFDPKNPQHGQGVKLNLPSGPLAWNGDKYAKDANGNYRFVYSGKDAQAGRNVNAIILEMPLAFLTKSPEADRIVNAWGESWVLKAAHKVETIADDRAPLSGPFWLEGAWALGTAGAAVGLWLFVWGVRAARASARPTKRSWVRRAIWTIAGLLLLLSSVGYGVVVMRLARQRPDLAKHQYQLDDELKKYKLVDTDGQAFADAGLNERDDDRQLGAFNIRLAPHLILRLAHLGWGFGPSISALGLKTAFDHGNSPISIHKTDSSLADAFKRARKVALQELNMPDAKWNKKGLKIPLRRAIEIFIPNVCYIDMDTTGTWPYGRRLEDQVATRFLALFLDMSAEFGGKKYHLDTLGDQALWDQAPIMPKTPPNPLKNDKPFLKEFPYLAEPW